MDKIWGFTLAIKGCIRCCCANAWVSAEIIKRKDLLGLDKMAHLIREPAAKPDSLCSLLGPTW